MNPQQLTAMHDQALTLAESGRYEEALKVLNDYLRHRPQDGQALNDAATVLFCLGQGQQAIALYEEACRWCTSEQLAQVQWNLCEAYLQEGRVAQAIGLFDQMESRGLLNVDMLHRAADMLLKKELLGPAVELLLRSLQMNPDQDVLKSMIEVIRSHRANTAFVIHRETTLTRRLADGLRQRLPLAAVEQSNGLESAQLPAETDIAVFFGCGRRLVDVSKQASPIRMVAVLDVQDLAGSELRAVTWRNVQAVILCGGQPLVQEFFEHIGQPPAGLSVLTAEPVIHPEQATFQPRKKGKRIAAFGPWDARRNPMFALMCFQKLHYLDPDTRLHLGGQFTDAAAEHYVRHLIETLELDNVVFLDGPIGDMKKWLRDKHYVLSTSIDGTGMEDIWQAMAFGLRPVVHRFPGVEQRLDSAYVFTLAEDFCDQVLNGPYDAAAHRAYVEQVCQERGLEQVLMDHIFQWEQELDIVGRHRMKTQSLTTEPAQESRIPPVGQTQSMNHSSIEQIASSALAATGRLQRTCLDLQPNEETAFFEADASEMPVVQDDPFLCGGQGGLSVEELTEIRRHNMQRRRKAQTSHL